MDQPDQHPRIQTPGHMERLSIARWPAQAMQAKHTKATLLGQAIASGVLMLAFWGCGGSAVDSAPGTDEPPAGQLGGPTVSVGITAF